MNEFSTVMASPGSAFQECTGSCLENVPTPKAVSSNLGLTNGLNVMARIEIVAILVRYQPSYNTSYTIKSSDPPLLAYVTFHWGCVLQAKLTSFNTELFSGSPE